MDIGEPSTGVTLEGMRGAGILCAACDLFCPATEVVAKVGILVGSCKGDGTDLIRRETGVKLC